MRRISSSEKDQTETASAIIAEAIALQSPSRAFKLPSEDERDGRRRMSASLKSIVNQSMMNLFVELENDSDTNEEEESLQERRDNEANLDEQNFPISMMKRSTDENENELKQKRSTDEDISESEQVSTNELSNSAISDDSAEILQIKSELLEALEKSKKLEHKMEEMKHRHDLLVKCLRFDIADLVEEKLNLEMQLLDQTCMNDIQRKDLEELIKNSGLKESLEENIKECQEELIRLLSSKAPLQSVTSDASRLKQVSASHQDVDKSLVASLLFAMTKTLNEYNDDKGKGSKNKEHNGHKNKKTAHRSDDGKGKRLSRHTPAA